MYNSDWIKHIAAGLTAIAITFVWAAFYVGSQIGEARGESNKNTAEYERHAEEKIRATCLSGQSGDIAECVSKVIKATNEDSRAEEDLVAQTEMARWAFYMLIATVGMSVITGAGVYYVWRTLSVTREIGQKQVRAYLSVDRVKIHDPGENPDQSGFILSLGAKNSGASPAIGCILRVSSRYYPVEAFAKIEPETWAVDRGIGDIDSSGMTTMAVLTCPKEVIQRCRDGAIEFEIAIKIKYFDVFGNSHEKTRFYYLYGPDFSRPMPNIPSSQQIYQ